MDLSQIGLKMNVTTKYSGKRSLLFLTIERATFWKMFLFCRTNSSFFTDIKMFVWAERTCWSKRSTRSLSRLDIPAEVLSSRWGHHLISCTCIIKNISTTVQLVEIQGWSWAIVVTTLIIVVDIAFTIIIFEMTLTLIIAIWSNWLQKSKWVDHCGSDLHSHQYQIDCVVVNIISSSGR